jgi:hypothetical protein
VDALIVTNGATAASSLLRLRRLYSSASARVKLLIQALLAA